MEFWPLTGREALLQEAERAVSSGHSVIVSGPAGIGKSRWCRELLDRLTPPYVVESVQGARATSAIPLGALWSLRLEAGTDPSVEAMTSAASALLERADGGRLVVGVDDADLLDPVSAVVLADVLRSGRAVMVLTCRERLVGGAAEPLASILDHGPAVMFELGPLDEPSVAALLEAVLAGPVDGSAVRRLCDLTGGNPLLLREVVHSARAGGELVLRRDWWHLLSSPRPTAALVELVGRRMNDLAPDAVDALEYLVLAGELELAVLEGLGAGPAVEQLEEAGLVQVDGATSLARIAHPLYGEVAVNRLTVSRRRRHVRRLSGPLLRTSPERCTVVVANWMLDGHLEPHPELLLEACRRVRGIDDGLAASFARSAMESGGGAPAVLALGETLVDLGDGEAAMHLLSSVDAHLLPEIDRVRIGLGHVAAMAWLQHDLDGALRALDELLNSLTLPSSRAELHAVSAGVNVFAGRLDRAAAETDQVLAQGEARASQRPLMVLAELAVTGMEGQHARLGPLVSEAEAMVSELFLDAPKTALRIGMALLLARVLMLAPEPLEVHSHDVYELGVALDVPSVRCAGAIGLGVAAMFSGRTVTAERRLGEAVAVGQLPHFGFVPYAADLAVMCAARRTQRGALSHDPMDTAWDGQRMPLFEPERLRAAGWREAARGRVSAAVRLANAAAELAADRGQRVFEVLALHDLVEFGAVDIAANRLAELASLSPFAAAAARRGAALRRRDVGEVLAAAADLAACGFLLDATVTARSAERLARAEGRLGLALGAAAAAGEYGSSCEEPPPPSDPAAGLLTAREREVATLAAEGRRDAEIAEELFVSVRTVQTHLARVYGKLGISGRKELVGLRHSPTTPPGGIT
jgi:DNA-binding CsgD family transcriptional regulator